jgi:riboflavin synthase
MAAGYRLLFFFSQVAESFSIAVVASTALNKQLTFCLRNRSMDPLDFTRVFMAREDTTTSLQVIMFTGLIESVGAIRSLQHRGSSAILGVELGSLTENMRLGDSVAINGVCLTVTQLNGTIGQFDVSQETLDKTTLGSLRTASKVNLERALQVGARMGGHTVQGHVDGLAAVSSLQQEQAFMRITVSVPDDLNVQIVPKGSIAVNGISLTVASKHDKGFSVAVIPETVRQTTLSLASVGDAVNLETDIVVKSVQQYLKTMLPDNHTSSGITLDKLTQLGF